MCLGIHKEYKWEKKTGLHQEENFDRSKKKTSYLRMEKRFTNHASGNQHPEFKKPFLNNNKRQFKSGQKA